MLWQSPYFMNISGKGVYKAWKTWSGSIDETAGKPRLVVIYDELEKALGTVTLRTDPQASAKGHNGLKSIMQHPAKPPFARIGVGIGRPESRESEDVANYVLRKMTPAEKMKVEGAVDQVIEKLREVERSE